MNGNESAGKESSHELSAIETIPPVPIPVRAHSQSVSLPTRARQLQLDRRSVVKPPSCIMGNQQRFPLQASMAGHQVLLS